MRRYSASEPGERGGDRLLSGETEGRVADGVHHAGGAHHRPHLLRRDPGGLEQVLDAPGGEHAERP
ncbi:MAG: hypothetical protein NZM07_08640, partial [Elioraea sp.]|nr:hypothetical protein [Elioraea sp.]